MMWPLTLGLYIPPAVSKDSKVQLLPGTYVGNVHLYTGIGNQIALGLRLVQLCSLSYTMAISTPSAVPS
jgi:hypothetical protein